MNSEIILASSHNNIFLPMPISCDTAHIWHIQLSDGKKQEAYYYHLLNQEEQERANRFTTDEHRLHFIVARSMLRIILSHYLVDCSAKDILFEYTKYQKPILSPQLGSSLTFNLSHSGNAALYAISTTHPIGIDIEKICPLAFEQIAKRYFCTEEYTALMMRSENTRLSGFYRLWSRKEALIKAIGKGLNVPLSSFCVSIDPCVEHVMIKAKTWYLFPLLTEEKKYHAALASAFSLQKIIHWTWDHHTQDMKRRDQYL